MLSKIKQIEKSTLWLIIAVIIFVMVISFTLYTIKFTKKVLPVINVSEEANITKSEQVSKENVTIIEKILDIISKGKNETREIKEKKENITEPKNITTTIIGPGIEVSEERAKSGKEVFVGIDVIQAFETNDFVEVDITTKETLNEKDIKEKIFEDVNQSEYKILDYHSVQIIASISKKAFDKIKNNENIILISTKGETKLTLADTSKIINFDVVNNLGYNGSGITVCVIDSGIDSDHPYLKGRVVAEKCFCTVSNYSNGGCCPPNGVSESNNASDDNGHGTHVAGIIASSHETYKGVSSGVGIAAVKIFNYSNGGDDGTTDKDIEKAIDWCVQNKDTYNIKIISMSFAKERVDFTNPIFCDLRSIGLNVTNAYNNGLFLAAASGNSGSIGILGEPACTSKAVSVGSTTKQDNIWPFTTRSVHLDFYAPGGVQGLAGNPPAFTDIVSLYSTRIKNDPTLCVRWVNDSGIWVCQDDDYDVGNYFIRLQGTSMATPHVSGSAALLQQFYYQKTGSYLSPNQIKGILNVTGVPIWDSEINKNVSRIDVAAAIFSLTTYQAGAIINGRVRQGQIWTVNLSVSNFTNKKLTVDLTWNSSDILDLTLISPTGQQFTNVLSSNHPQRAETDNPTSGIWTVKVKGTNVNGFTDFTVTTSQTTIGTPPQGINFTFTKLNYISACNNSNEGLTVVLKGESNSSKPIVDVSNKTNMTSKAFLAGLVIPNHKMLVNLPLGKVDVDTYLAHTETGRVMLDADVKLKFSAFNTQASIDEYKSIIQQLYSLYEQSPYVNEIKNSGYDGYPQWEAATWISPNSLKAEGEGCKIFLTNTTLKVESKLKWSYSNIDGFNVRQEAKDDVNTRFNSWKGNLTQWLNNNAQRAQAEVNSDSKYDDLRYVYASVALAQWYKTLDRSQVLFGDVIDSNDIYTYDLNISFDKAYWEGQANQRITNNFNLNSCFKQGWTSCYAWIYGGVVYVNLNTNVTSVLNNETKQVVTNAINTVYGQKASENNTFYYANFIEPKKAELKSIDLWFSTLRPYKNRNFNISIAIENKGTVSANNFSVNFNYNYTNVDGSYAIYPIGSISNQNVSANNIIVIKKELNFSTLGTHKIFADVDYNNNVKESNELNNLISKSINILTTYPTANITSPTHRAAVNSPVTLTGTGSDELDGTLTNTSLNWSSNVDGFLGYGTSLMTNLSTSNHVITLTVTNSLGNKAYASISLSVFPADFPIVKIITPLSNEFFPEGRAVYFEGESQDKQDGLITGNSLEWNSSINGFLSYGKTFSNKSLSVGTHTITFKATDSDGHVSTTQLNITVLEGTPTATINKPSNNAKFFFENPINFSGTASDLQDGDLSTYQWTSSIDGVIGNAKNFLKNLSSGAHTITLTTVDSDGLTDTDSVSIEVFPTGYSLINVISPRNKQILTHGESLQFNSSGQDFNGIIPDSSFNWTSNLNGLLGFGKVFALNTTNLTIGSHNITLKVNNTIGTINIISLNVTILNSPPIVSLTSPSPGSIFDEKQLINFTGSGSDLEDGTLPNSSLNWTSSLDGFLGIGTFINKTLSKGTHSITLKGTDSLGTNTTAVSNIVVTGLGNITLTILSDGSAQKNLVYNASGSKVVYLRIPKGANITKAVFNLTGMSNENP